MSQRVKFTDGNVTVEQQTFVTAAPEAGQRQGRWYSQVSAGVSVLELVADRLYLVPFLIHRKRTPAKLAVYVSTAGAAGSVLRLGIYGDLEGTPSPVVADLGTVAGDSTGSKEIANTTELEPGVYWLAVAGQGAPATQPTLRGTNFRDPLVGVLGVGSLGTPGYYAGSAVAGALPALGVNNVIGAAIAPNVWVQM